MYFLKSEGYMVNFKSRKGIWCKNKLSEVYGEKTVKSLPKFIDYCVLYFEMFGNILLIFLLSLKGFLIFHLYLSLTLAFSFISRFARCMERIETKKFIFFKGPLTKKSKHKASSYHNTLHHYGQVPTF